MYWYYPYAWQYPISVYSYYHYYPTVLLEPGLDTPEELKKSPLLREIMNLAKEGKTTGSRSIHIGSTVDELTREFGIPLAQDDSAYIYLNIIFVIKDGRVVGILPFSGSSYPVRHIAEDLYNLNIHWRRVRKTLGKPYARANFPKSDLPEIVVYPAGNYWVDFRFKRTPIGGARLKDIMIR